MANHDYIISNQTFPSFRTDLNNGLSAIATNNSSASAPATTYPYQWWYDTSANQLKIRNADNDAWILIGTFNQTLDTVQLNVAVLAYPTIGSISPTSVENTASSIVITGTNFVITPTVEFHSTTGAVTLANSVTRDSATQLTVNVTLPVDGTYFIRVENPDGLAVRSSTALLSVSDAPTWTTASGSIGSVAKGGAFSATVLATSDSDITYSVQSGSLPTGLSINGTSGAITGTESGGDTGETVYTFTLRATDEELQIADRVFTITVTVGINNGIQFN
tara:strand:- start:571 stop:1401 length:831 start_codon:yes stop_codon:yes gene_type:complete